MSQTSEPSAPVHAEAKPHPKFIALLAWMPVHKSAITLVLSWLMPFIIMAVGYFFFTPLRMLMTWPWRAPPELWAGIALQLVITIVWILYEIWYTTHRNSSVRQLQADVVGDLSTTIILLVNLGAALNASSLQWYFIVPMCGALVDLFQSTLLGINNAAEKPFVGTKGST